MENKLELLLPAWDMEKLKFAFAYWADAVYVWVPMFSLRARTNAFNMETLKEAVDYAHSLWKKIYFTANIYAHNSKIKPFLAQFEKMLSYGPDAFIMSDPGLINIIRKNHPEAIIHLSVQANNTNWAQVAFWKEIGVSRIILSREISIREIKEIHEAVPDIELEAFVHWAICMAYSGRCLISNYLSWRDPNQWTCSHSCRWEYKVFKESLAPWELENATGRPDDYKALDGSFYLEEAERPGEFMPIDEDEHGTYLMNSRDLMWIDYVKDLRDVWVISFKVEWRNKTVNYIASVWKAYREALDCVEDWTQYDTKKLSDELFSIANRWYIPGFLAWNPWANAQFYERNWWFQEKLFIWKVLAYNETEKLCKIEVKNKFEIWDKIEFLSPTNFWEEDVKTIKRITNINRADWSDISMITIKDENLVDEQIAHPGSFDVWVNCEKNPWDFSIVRKKI